MGLIACELYEDHDGLKFYSFKKETTKIGHKKKNSSRAWRQDETTNVTYRNFQRDDWESFIQDVRRQDLTGLKQITLNIQKHLNKMQQTEKKSWAVIWKKPEKSKCVFF